MALSRSISNFIIYWPLTTESWGKNERGKWQKNVHIQPSYVQKIGKIKVGPGGRPIPTKNTLVTFKYYPDGTERTIYASAAPRRVSPSLPTTTTATTEPPGTTIEITTQPEDIFENVSQIYIYLTILSVIFSYLLW